jgi:hypothetical protein
MTIESGPTSNPGPTFHPRPAEPKVPTASANSADDPFMKAQSAYPVSDDFYLKHTLDKNDVRYVPARTADPHALLIDESRNIALLAQFEREHTENKGACSVFPHARSFGT